MGKRSLRKIRFTAWVPVALEAPLSEWLKANPRLNRTEFVVQTILEKLNKHGVQVPPDMVQDARYDRVECRHAMTIQRGNSLAAFGEANSVGLGTVKSPYLRGNRLMLCAWIDQRLAGGIELLLRDRPHINRSGLMTEAVIEKLRRDAFMESTRPLAIAHSRKPLRVEAFEGVHLHGDAAAADAPNKEPKTPRRVNLSLALSEAIKSLPLSGFEGLCEQVLLTMGAKGFNLAIEKGRGHSHIFEVGRLRQFGKSKVFVRCTNRRKTTTHHHIAEFRKAIMGKADIGMMMVAGVYTPRAIGEAKNGSQPTIEPLSGEDLVAYLQSVGLGVVRKTDLEVDNAFFDRFRK